MEEGVLPMVAAHMTDEATHDHHSAETEALIEIDTAIPGLVAISIPTFLLARVGAAVQPALPHPISLVPHLENSPDARAVQLLADLDLDPDPVPPPIEAAEEERGTAQTTVISTHPGIPRSLAHAISDGTPADRVPSSTE